MSLYVILRNGCHECGEPVEILGCYESQEAAHATAYDMVGEGKDWRWVPLEVWKCEPGAVEMLSELAYSESEGRIFEIKP